MATPDERTAVTAAREEHETASDLAVRRRFGVVRLLQVRPDLRGAYAFADVVEESTRGCA